MEGMIRPPPPPFPRRKGGGDPNKEEEEAHPPPPGVAGLYAMGFRVAADAAIAAQVVVQERMPTLLCVSVMTPSDGTIELFLIERTSAQKGEGCWMDRAEALLEAEGLMRVQVTERIIDDSAQGSACVARLIDRRMAQLRCDDNKDNDEDDGRGIRMAVALMHEGFFDAYRAASDQQQHPLDPRLWRMPPHAIARTQRQHRALCEELHLSIQERFCLAQYIDHFQALMHTTRSLIALPAHAAALLDDAGDLENWEVELRALEAREMELLHTIDETQTRARQLCLILQRQTMIACLQQRPLPLEEEEEQPSASSSSGKRKRRSSLSSCGGGD